jgi:hypothetical protein
MAGLDGDRRRGGAEVAKPPMGLGVYEGRPAVDKPGAEPRRVGNKKGHGHPSGLLGSDGSRNLNCTT